MAKVAFLLCLVAAKQLPCDDGDKYLMVLRGGKSSYSIVGPDGVVLGQGAKPGIRYVYDEVCLPDGCYSVDSKGDDAPRWSLGPYWDGGSPENASFWQASGGAGTKAALVGGGRVDVLNECPQPTASSSPSPAPSTSGAPTPSPSTARPTPAPRKREDHRSTNDVATEEHMALALRNAFPETTVYLKAVVTATAGFTLPLKAKATIDGAGEFGIQAKTTDPVLYVNTGGELHLRDVFVTGGFSQGAGGSVFVAPFATAYLLRSRIENSQAAASGGAIWVSHDASLTLDSSSIVNCSAGHSGGAVATAASSNIALVRSVISHCTAGVAGGAVSAGTASDVRALSMTIASCHADSAGGAFSLMDDGTLVVSNQSTIRGCSTLGHGGGVAVSARGIVSLEAASEIVDCRAHDLHKDALGGGIFGGVGATLRVGDGSAIRRCSASGTGGGAHVESRGFIILERDSIVEKCDADVSGGGLSIGSSSALEMTHGASVVDCHSNECGGGIRLDQGARAFVGDDATVAQCSASWGGGVCASQASVTLADRANIIDCHGYEFGGAISLQAESTAELRHGVTLARCYADRDAGAVYVGAVSSVHVHDDVLVENNTAVVSGGGFMAQSGGSLIFGGRCVVRGNRALYGDGGAVRASKTDVVSIRGPVAFEANEARRGAGGAIFVEGTTLYASEGACSFVRVDVDFTQPGSSYGSYALFPADSPTATADARGEYAGAEAKAGEAFSRYYCLLTDPNLDRPFIIAGYEQYSYGWSGGKVRLSYPLADDGVLRYSEPVEMTVPVSSHANTVQFKLPASDGDEHPLFANNAAASGGAIALNMDAVGVVAGSHFVGNDATVMGGAILTGKLCKLDASGAKFDFNRAAKSGGALSVEIEAGVTVRQSLALQNWAGAAGGFAALDAASEVVLASVFAARNAVGDGDTDVLGGGALFAKNVRDVEMRNCTFQENQVRGRGGAGGAVQASNSKVTIYATAFSHNAVEGVGGGAVAALDGSMVQFKPIECSRISVVVDWRRTTRACVASGPGEGTCEMYTAELLEQEKEDGVDCSGCAGSSNVETWFAVVNARTGQILEWSTPYPAQLTRFSYCLAPGDYSVVAYTKNNMSWWGGSFWVVDEELRRTYDGGRVFTETSDPVHLSLDLPFRGACSMSANRANDGGGGGTFWDSHKPAGLDTVLVLEPNEAHYGPDVATPARSLAFEKDRPQGYFTNWGVAMEDDPIVVLAVDSYGERVTTESGTFAKMSVSGNATVENGLAVFEEGAAIFDHAVVKSARDSLVPVSFTSPLTSVPLHTNVSLRSCKPGEVSDGLACYPCAPGKYWRGDATTLSRHECRQCPRGLECNSAGLTLASLRTLSSYYRTTPTSETAYWCHTRRSGCPGGTNKAEDAQCALGYGSVGCGACSHGYYSFMDPTGHPQCHKCTHTAEKLAILAVVGVVAFFASIACYVVLTPGGNAIFELRAPTLVACPRLSSSIVTTCVELTTRHERHLAGASR